MEHKTLGSLVVKSADKGLATAIFSRFGGPPDSDDDITEQGAFTDGAVAAVSSYNHASALPGGPLPVGKATIRVRQEHAEADVQFFLGTAAGRDAFQTVKELGPLVQWSYAYDVIKAARGKWSGQPVRILQKLDVYELSPVLRGAGRDTMTVAGSMKSDDARMLTERAELLSIRDGLRLSDTRLRDEILAIKQRLELCAIKEAFVDQGRRYWSESTPPGPSTVHAAWQALKLCCAELDVDFPLLRWFRSETEAEASYAKAHGWRDWPHFATDQNVRGAWHAPTRTIWIGADLPVKTVIATVAHEVRHAAGGDEAQAQAYESQWVATVPSVN